MKNLKKIYESYQAADGFLSNAESNASTQRDRQYWGERRSLNDQAYFLMMFAQLEDYINEKCQKLIGRKKASRKWVMRRLWDTVKADELQFKKKVALLTDKSGAVYKKVIDYYKIRCGIAHGTIYSPVPVSVPVVAQDILSIVKRLKV